MSEKTISDQVNWMEEAERRMNLDEAALIEEIKRRKNPNQPGVPAEKMKMFRKLLGEEIKRTGTLTREYAEQLLRKLHNGEL